MQRPGTALALSALFFVAGCAHSTSSTRSATVSDTDAVEILRLAVEADSSGRGARETDEWLWQLSGRFEQAGLFNLAFIYGASVAKGGSAHRDEAIEALARLQEVRQDDFLIPSLLMKRFENATTPVVTAVAVDRVRWLLARIFFRRGALPQVVTVSGQSTPTNLDGLRCLYLEALAFADDRLDGAARRGEASRLLEQVLGGLDAKNLDMEAMRPHVLLALGRLAFAQRQWSAAADWYERAAKHPRHAAVARLELAHVFIQQAAWARALWLLRQPEVRELGPTASLTEAIAAHFSGDGRGAEVALGRISAEGAPATWKDAAPTAAYEAYRSTADSPLLRRVRANLRVSRLMASLDSFEAERRVVAGVARWQGTATGTQFETWLRQNHEFLQQVAATVILKTLQEEEAADAVAAAQADLVGIEVALARRDLDVAIERTERVLAGSPANGPATSDLLFRLAAMKQARAEVLTGADAELEKAEVAAVLERIVAGDPAYQRLDEARRLLAESR